MTFVPNQEPPRATRSAGRTFLFWLVMLVFAIVLWQMFSTGGKDQGPVRQMSYSDFINQVDLSNVTSVRLLVSPTTAKVEGTLRLASQRFETTIPREVIPDLTERLRKQEVTVEVVELRDASPAKTFQLLAPFILILIAVAFVITKMRARQRPPGGPPPQNQPLGD